MKKIRWCVIGAGGIADRRTIPALLKDKNNELTAIMENNETVAKTVSAKYGVKYFLDEEEMLKNAECDAVYIGTPVFCHYKQALICLKYGKHVFIEKPICLTSREGKALVEAFEKAKKALYVGYMMKFHNLHVKARKLVEEGLIGKPNDVRLQFSCWYPEIKGAWRQNKALGGGGAIMDLGVHCVELAEYILQDEITEVKALYTNNNFSYEVEDSGVIIFKTGKGVLGHVDVNFNIPDAVSLSKLELYGDKGYIMCDRTIAQEEKGTMSHLYSPQGDYEAMQIRSVAKPKRYRGANGNLYLKQIRSFTSMLNKNQTDCSTAKKAVHIQEIIEKAYADGAK